jgi:hypothetical protein
MIIIPKKDGVQKVSGTRTCLHCRFYPNCYIYIGLLKVLENIEITFDCEKFKINDESKIEVKYISTIDQPHPLDEVILVRYGDGNDNFIEFFHIFNKPDQKVSHWYKLPPSPSETNNFKLLESILRKG